ncbi:unnamed protein product [Allacma fusca]|uniref:Uncharacterized protein n=1 Tax=Allacma fusca TaxID=39272 RepID=A0A8J2L091_9HEXA|nr:unnamed protein product [Allacma fusca]
MYPFVKSPAGNFVGLALPSRLGKWYNEFRGIPYAETPRRFEDRSY